MVIMRNKSGGQRGAAKGIASCRTLTQSSVANLFCAIEASVEIDDDNSHYPASIEE